MNTANKLNTEQEERISEVEGGTTFRLRLGQHRLSEFVAWVFMVMPAIAPLPNLFNLTYAIGHVLGNDWFSYATAFLICLSIELMLIGVSEQLNGVIDKWLRAHENDKGLYHLPLMITGSGSLLIVLIMLGLVYHYEVSSTQNYTALTLPFISVLSVAFMGVRSYMLVVEKVKHDEHEHGLNAEHKLNAELNAELNTMREQLEQKAVELVQYTEKYDLLMSEHNELKTELAVKSERASMLEDTVNMRPRGNADTQQRRDALLNILLDEFDGSPSVDVNKSALASMLDTTHTTIGRDIKALEKAGRLSMNGSVKVNTNGVSK